MTTQTFFLPKGRATNDVGFTWNLGTGVVQAESATFYLNDFAGALYWMIVASTGNFEDENYFSFVMTLPFTGDESFAGIYELRDGLTFTHGHWIPAPPGFDGLRTVTADSAILNIIKYDAGSDIVEGTFEAVFKTDGYRLNPKGTFNLKRVRGLEAG